MGFISGSFKTLGCTTAGLMLGYVSARAGMGSYALGNDATGMIGISTGGATLLASYVTVAQSVQSRVAKLGLAFGLSVGALYTANELMPVTLTTARINDSSYERTLGYQGSCARAGNVQVGEDIRQRLPANCSLKYKAPRNTKP